jgi:putative DNA primase/helicase
MFSSQDPYAGVDLDHCRDPATGRIEPWAQDIIGTMDSYSETSASGTGVHIIVVGTLPPKGCKRGDIEMYDTARFFTATGDHLEGTPRTIEPRQAELEALHRRVWPELYQPIGAQVSRPPPSDSAPPPLSDWTILGMACCARNWEKFQDLFDFGSWRDCGYQSQSEADLGLCCLLAFYTRDAAQLDRLFRQSKLYRPKWDERRGAQTYGEQTIQKAIASCATVYTPRRDC